MNPIDARTLDNNTLIQGDLCIIGAGAAGISIACELLGTPYKVILLESGGFEYDDETQSLYEGKNIGLPYFALNQSRLRFFGGTTNHWTGMCAPLDPIDFEKRGWIPYSGWPISWSDLEPYYPRAQKVCQLGPYRYDMEFWEQQEPDLKKLPLDSSKMAYKIFQYSPPTRFGQVYRESLLKANNIVLWTYANVTAIETTVDAARVKGLRIKCLTGKEHQVQARYYVLACGALENARLLLVSNEIEGDGLGNRHDLVGRFFMEHIHIGSARLLVSTSLPLQYVAERGKQEKVHLTISEEWQRKHKLLNCAFDLYPVDLFSSADFDYLQHQVSAEDIKLYLAALQNLKQSFAVDKRDPLPFLETSPTENKRELMVFSALEQIPNPASRVTLERDKDRLGMPKLQLDWRLTDLERQTIEQATQIMGYEMGRTGLGRLQILDWLTEKTDFWPQFPQVLRGGYHQMGTTRMSDNPKTGVVDSNCQVFGVSNLYIAGSSVYPTAGTANPTLTLVALAIRLADHLKRLLS
ncbi:MAG: GMC family oxidoreductase [Oscillatoriales cyanobacterium]|nr:MAG: GMC family oxidoreductase [Oscillatoriales cyanobacterium]TAH23160.1 MAG: GMC family oxidoreductase [Oscillatoriales cyanobacterium]